MRTSGAITKSRAKLINNRGINGKCSKMDVTKTNKTLQQWYNLPRIGERRILLQCKNKNPDRSHPGTRTHKPRNPSLLKDARLCSCSCSHPQPFPFLSIHPVSRASQRCLESACRRVSTAHSHGCDQVGNASAPPADKAMSGTDGP